MQDIGRFLDGVLGLSATTANELTVAQVGLRALIVYFTLIFFVRLGKKRFLGQATAFDAVLLIMIGSLASRAVSGTAPFVATLVATFTFIVVHWLISYASERSTALGSLVKGHDTTLIKNGRVDRTALRDAHMSDDDLAEDLRQQGVADSDDVKEARLERSGRLSVIKK
ncbi:MAG TPA: YetF domain-containing protein [Terriglobales bacterium]|nr:YetF domain-containing protein [Terriglobales bacterium]